MRRCSSVDRCDCTDQLSRHRHRRRFARREPGRQRTETVLPGVGRFDRLRVSSVQTQSCLPPTGFDTGYVDVFAARLRELQPGLTLVNYGCPGETTRSFLKGPCPWTEFGQQLHDSFTGSQLDAAIAFLRAHPGEVSPITLTLWGNNVREFVSGCGDDACVLNGAVTVIDDLSKDLAKILKELRKEAPDADIIVTGSWDFVINRLEFADPLFRLLNASMAATAAAESVRFADPFPLFNPQGDLTREIQTLCALLLLCTENDSHPSDLGYQVLGNLVFDVSGYGLLVP